jgi:putative DNA primase/helicase
MNAPDDLARLAGLGALPADEQPWPEPLALPELTEPHPCAFSSHALGSVLGPAVQAIASAVQTPEALAAGSVLAAAAVACQPLADVRMPHGQAAPLSLFMVTVAGSGDRKSACDSAACVPIEERRRQDARDHAHALSDYKADRRKRKDGDHTSEPPTARTLVVSKGTVEGMHQLLKGQPALGMFSTEGAEVVGGHSLREERKASGIAWLLKAWGVETLDAMTKGDGLSVLPGRRFSLHVLLQPVIAQQLMSDPLAQGQGWIARCLMCAPQSLAGSRLFDMTAQALHERPEVLRYFARLRELLQTTAPVLPDGDGNELCPRALTMTAEAAGLWIEFYNEAERQQATGQALAAVRPWASKAAEHAARLAGIVALMDDPETLVVNEAAMQGGIELANFYLGEHVRLMGHSTERNELRRLAKLLDWLREQGRWVPQRDVLQRSPRELRDLKAQGLGELMAELQRRGLVRRAADGWEVRDA